MSDYVRLDYIPVSIIEERNLALQEIYKRIYRTNVNKHLLDNRILVSLVLEEPAPKFYISPARAKILIMQYKNGTIPPKTRLNKLKMIEDLVSNYETLCKKYPNTDKEILYEYVVEQPAKSFYLTFARARDIILNYKRKGRKHR